MAKFLNGSRAEKDIALTIEVVDMNDNAPVIKAQQVGEVDECSSPGEYDLQTSEKHLHCLLQLTNCI